MPWSNQNGGGGPWGGGGGNNQGPWGQGPNRPRGTGGGNGGPPDLEEIIRRGQDQLKNVVPGGFNGGIVVIALLLLGVFWLMNSIYTVQPDERGVELRFGKPKEEISMPGLHFHFWPFETVEVAKITEQQQNIGRLSAGIGNENSGLMLTGDQNIVNVQFSVLYSVTDPRAYLFNLENPAATLQQVSESAMREIVGRRPAQDIFRDNRQARCSAPSRTRTVSSRKPTNMPTRSSARPAVRRPRFAKRRRPIPTASSRKRKVRRNASCRSTMNIRRHPTSPASASSSKRWKACSRIPRR